MVRGEGAYLWDQEGRRYLDFTSGIGVTNTGHCHPQVVTAVREQAGRILHLQANIACHEPMLRLTARLRQVVPAELDSFFFSNSGAEAVEAALKLARHATRRTNVIAFQRAFHGRTVGTMSLTSSRTLYRTGYQPLIPGVFLAPYAYCYRCPKSQADPQQYACTSCPCDWVLEQVRFLLKSQTAPEETAAILVEPVLGEGGYVVPPVHFLRGLREICNETGILLILDEVQTGFGRTGRFFALEHFGVTPDILVMAKGMASGLPLSGIAARRELMERWQPESHGSTCGGNPVACAAAEATIRVLQEEGLVENSALLGAELLTALRTLRERYPGLGDVRGLGLMVGVEFVVPGGRIPDKDRAKAVQRACVEEGLLLLTCGTEENVIRWIPPLVIGRRELETALTIFEDALDQAIRT